MSYKVLIVGSFQYSIYAPAFVSGFRELGHEVEYIDTNKYKNESFLAILLNKIQGKYYYGLPLYRLNRDIIKKVDEFRPDIVFFYHCMVVFRSTYRRIKKMGISFFTYTNDDPFSSVLKKPWCRKFHDSLPMADWNFVYRKKNILDYNEIGLVNVSVLKPYYIKNSNFPMGKQRIIPIAFMGHWENDGRDEYVEALLGAKVPLFIYGDDATWSRSRLYKRLKDEQVLRPRKIGAEYNSTINELLLDIVFLSKLNNDTYTRRCFEIPATKTCMICEYTDDMNEMFPENECAVYFKSPSDLVVKTQYYLNHPEECERIGRNAYIRLSEIGGSEVDRCQEIINKYFDLRNKTK